MEQNPYNQAAWQVLSDCIIPEGLLASSANKDNYRRIWARDSMIAGITGLLGNRQNVIAAFQDSVLSLMSNQAANGQIPSNVGLGSKRTVSFGSLAGRVDATTWWIIGACICSALSNTKVKPEAIEQPVAKAFEVLKAWEMNQRGLVYTPLGGNWADEYISEGYTLYDNVLRIWAYRLAAKVFNKIEYDVNAKELSNLLIVNFYYNSNNSNLYHSVAYKNAEAKPYFWFKLGPQGYDTRWDMAGNALVLLLGIHPEPTKLEQFLFQLAEEYDNWMLPVFHPVIKPNDIEWKLLEKNYSYSFKNAPYHFHNGGCWPVFMGLLALGLRVSDIPTPISQMKSALLKALSQEEPAFSFHEFWSTNFNEPGGVNPLAYTASGFLMLDMASSKEILNPLNAILP